MEGIILNSELFVTGCAFLAVTLIVMLVGLASSRGKDPVEHRVEQVARTHRRTAPYSTNRDPSAGAIPKLGQKVLPKDEQKLGRMKAQLTQAGLYQRHSSQLFAFGKFGLLVVPMMAGALMSALGLATLKEGLLWGCMVGLAGNVLPSVWLSRLKTSRQKSIRRALPDALDVIVICLEAGLSLPAAFARVASELRQAHPLLAAEMAIMQREVQLGHNTGEALRKFADRFDLEELRSLASVVGQAEKFGASVTKALRVHADTLRMKRFQYAEAQAQKAPVKLIFPTVLCIFPALYVVLMGPAGVHLWELLEKM